MQHERRRGKLTIFLGAATGAGKTCAMLEAAHSQRADGADVVVGDVQTHGRRRTEELLHGLPRMPRQVLSRSGVTAEEMHLDAILRRNPELVLIDELAHTNAPGSRHARRFQDVEELLHRGIDVYATLNIQHLESLNDIVAQITGVIIQETLPDRIFEQADQIVFVDVPPEELLRRMQVEPLDPAMQEFLRPGNLIALRELALRRTAQRVGRDLIRYMGAHRIRGPWPADERILVCLGSHPLSERLVRTARRLAASLDAEWIALHVAAPDEPRPLAGEQTTGARLTRLVEELGGEAETVVGLDIVETIAEYAKSHNITKIIIGKPIRSRLLELWRGSLVDQISKKCHGIDVYVISAPAAAHLSTQRRFRFSSPWRGYLAAMVMVGAITLAGVMMLRHVDPTNLVMFYLLAVVVAGLRWGRGPAALASVIGVTCFDFFFVPPRLSLTVSDVQYLITFAALLVVGLVVGTLTGRLREQMAFSRRREEESAALYGFTRSMVAAHKADEVCEAVVQHVRTMSGRSAAVYLAAEDRLMMQESPHGRALDETELTAANWTFIHGQPAGKGANTLQEVQGYYLPLQTARRAIGVLAIWPGPDGRLLTLEQQRLLEVLAAQSAVTIERAQLAEAARQAQLLSEADRLHKTLLNSISHDLRTPLVSVIGVLTTLMVQDAHLSEQTRRELIETAREEGERLNRLVGNLLDMTRLESGILRLAADWHDVTDIFGTALDQMKGVLHGRPVHAHVPAETPLVYVDYVLVVQVLSNLLDNANKYSPPGLPVEIEACPQEGEVIVRVGDQGTWIPVEHRERIFDKFFRIEQPGGPSGTGLGLAICKGFVDAHHGQIWAEPRPGGGTLVAFTLPTHPPADGGDAHDHDPAGAYEPGAGARTCPGSR